MSQKERVKREKIKLLHGIEGIVTKPLWERVFSEDGERFINYYYKYKVPDNSIYTIEDSDGICAMLQLNPYIARISGAKNPWEVHVDYIVGVATAEEKRNKGHMKSLLHYSLRQMYEDKKAFTFLMPANEEIYKPFDFRFIYDKEQWVLNDAVIELTHVRRQCKEEVKILSDCALAVSFLEECDIEGLVNFSNAYLGKNYRLYMKRDSKYYKTLAKELACQNGGICLLKDGIHIVGYFFYYYDRKAKLQEAVLLPEYESFEIFKETGKTRPAIMARVIHLEEFIKAIRAVEETALILKIEDSIIPENNGVFSLHLGARMGSFERLEWEEKYDSLGTVSIGDLTGILFGYGNIAEKMNRESEMLCKLGKILPISPCFINEIV